MIQSGLRSNPKKFCRQLLNDNKTCGAGANDVFFSKIDTRKDVLKVSSRASRVPLQVRPGSKWGFFNPAGGALGRGAATHYDHSDLTPIASRQAVEINQDVLDQTNDDAKAIRKILSLEIKNAMRDFRTQMNVQIQLAGDNVIGSVSALPGGNVITLGNGPYYSQMVRAGQLLTVYDTTVTTNRGTCTVQFVDYPNNNVTVDAIPPNTVVGDNILPEGVAGANPVGYFGVHSLMVGELKDRYIGGGLLN